MVVFDALRFSTTVTDAVARGDSVPLDVDARVAALDGAAVAERAGRSGAVVLLGCLRNAGAAAVVRAEQQRRGPRPSVAIVAAGELAGRKRGGSVRFAVEDRLGAGAIVDALADVGIDRSRPEAAVACEAFRGLRGRVRPLLTASGSGQELIERGARDEVANAAAVGAASVVAVLRDGVFLATPPG